MRYFVAAAVHGVHRIIGKILRISPEKDTATAVSLYQLQDEHNEMGKMSIAQTNSNDRRSLVRMPF
ncbi:MAG: hypothetical protein KKG98_01120, partial [Proteobacteria bacterium]|nr:hypothetical protein [Pseudomonadota bacterium]MCG2822417.1 hypothetical protein [Desulfobulbaceae bacterium]